VITYTGRNQAIATLKEAGIPNPLRTRKLIRDVIDFLQLDLTGLTVLTEAASGPYVVTPVIACLAGAKRVLALTGNSIYATADGVVAQTRALEMLCEVEDCAEIYSERKLDLFAQAEIVTNLGFVRPIDSNAVEAMKETAVVTLMCESWEYRSEDVDLPACKAKGIRVWGTNEDYPGLDIFSYSGWLCMKMLFDAQIEIHKSHILVVSTDKFGIVIENQLERAGALVRRINTFRDISKSDLTGIDVIVVADYTRTDTILGQDGDISPCELSAIIPDVSIIQYAGHIDVNGLKEFGIYVYPGIELGPRRMSLTLAMLAVRPVVELHGAGIKVGEMCARARLREINEIEMAPFVTDYSTLVQVL